MDESKVRPRLPFWSKVTRGADSDCWPWQGYRKPSGHGLTSHKSMPIHASRKAYILTYGPIAPGLCVNHRCDNAACCNPLHMYLGTRSDNMIDFWNRTPPDQRKHGGRPSKLTEAQLEKLWKLRKHGATLKECAAEFDVHVATICRYITAVRKKKVEKLRAVRLSRRETARI